MFATCHLIYIEKVLKNNVSAEILYCAIYPRWRFSFIIFATLLFYAQKHLYTYYYRYCI